MRPVTEPPSNVVKAFCQGVRPLPVPPPYPGPLGKTGITMFPVQRVKAGNGELTIGFLGRARRIIIQAKEVERVDFLFIVPFPLPWFAIPEIRVKDTHPFRSGSWPCLSKRSEKRSEGIECVSTCTSRWA